MKKIALLSLVAAAMALPAVANAQTAAAPAAAQKIAPGGGAPVVVTAVEKKVELKDGSWADVKADGSVTVSKDGGKTWMPAPDGAWETKDGAKITTKGGKEVK
ncbi:MAG: CopK family periplasmic copper-binding protein [Pseudomonadota bacterium]|nr:CopK family periplasmic copper-binding protein [Pseudomonadota bacterium]